MKLVSLVLCIYLALLLLDFASSCQPLNRTLFNDCVLAGYNVSGDFTPSTSQRELSSLIANMQNKFKNCSSLSTLMSCSVQLPKCSSRNSTLPCKDVCKKFVADCQQGSSDNDGLIALFRGICELLPSTKCLSKPNNLNNSHFEAVKCQSLVIRQCQNAGYNMTSVSIEYQKMVESSTNFQNIDANSTLRKIICMEIAPPCDTKNTQTLLVPCRSMCNEAFNESAQKFVEIFKAKEYCSTFPENANIDGKEYCSLQTWPGNGYWPSNLWTSLTTAAQQQNGSIDSTKPSLEQNATTPAPNVTTPAPNVATPGTNETTPAPTPATNVTTAAPNVTTPAANATTPGTTSAPNGTTPAPNVTPPAPNVTTPAPNATTPSANATTSAPNVTTPAPNATTPSANVTTSAPNVTTPAPNATTPSANVTTSAPNVTTSAPNATTPAPNATTSTANATTPAPNATTTVPNVTTPAPKTNRTAPSPTTNGSAPTPKTNGSATTPTTNGSAPTPTTNETIPSPTSNRTATTATTNGTAPAPTSKVTTPAPTSKVTTTELSKSSASSSSAPGTKGSPPVVSAHKGGKMSAGAIAGTVVGMLVLLVVIVVAAICFRKHRQTRSQFRHSLMVDMDEL